MRLYLENLCQKKYSAAHFYQFVFVGNNASVGIGTTAPKAKLDVTGGNILVGSRGQGIVLKSLNSATCKLLSIDNAGAMVLTTVACP